MHKHCQRLKIKISNIHMCRAYTFKRPDTVYKRPGSWNRLYDPRVHSATYIDYVSSTFKTCSPTYLHTSHQIKDLLLILFMTVHINVTVEEYCSLWQSILPEIPRGLFTYIFFIQVTTFMMAVLYNTGFNINIVFCDNTNQYSIGDFNIALRIGTSCRHVRSHLKLEF